MQTDDLLSQSSGTALVAQYDIWSSLRNVFIITIRTVLFHLKELFGRNILTK